MSALLPFLVQLAASAAAVTALVGLAAWIGLPRVTGSLTEAQVRAALDEEHPELPVDEVILDPGGRSALVRSGAQAFTVRRVGDGHAVAMAPTPTPTPAPAPARQAA